MMDILVIFNIICALLMVLGMWENKEKDQQVVNTVGAVFFVLVATVVSNI